MHGVHKLNMTTDNRTEPFDSIIKLSIFPFMKSSPKPSLTGPKSTTIFPSDKQALAYTSIDSF